MAHGLSGLSVGVTRRDTSASVQAELLRERFAPRMAQRRAFTCALCRWARPATAPWGAHREAGRLRSPIARQARALKVPFALGSVMRPARSGSWPPIPCFGRECPPADLARKAPPSLRGRHHAGDAALPRRVRRGALSRPVTLQRGNGGPDRARRPDLDPSSAGPHDLPPDPRPLPHPARLCRRLRLPNAIPRASEPPAKPQRVTRAPPRSMAGACRPERNGPPDRAARSINAFSTVLT